MDDCDWIDEDEDDADDTLADIESVLADDSDRDAIDRLRTIKEILAEHERHQRRRLSL